MTGTYCLYCIHADGTDLAKIGISGRPELRISTIRTCTSLAVSLVRVLRFRTFDEASVWERIILRDANRASRLGEWVFWDAKLLALLDSVKPSEDVTGQYARFSQGGRKTPDAKTNILEIKLARAKVKAQAGTPRAVIPECAKSDADLGYQRGLIHARLAQGLGSEDCRVLDGVPVEAFRAEVIRLREAGELYSAITAFAA